MKKLTMIILVLLISSSLIELNAQNSAVDSLENLLKKHKKQDTIRVNLLNEIAIKSNQEELDKTLKYAKIAGELADKLDFTKGKAESLRIIGIYYLKKSDYSQAFENYQKSLKIYEEIGDKKGVSICLNNIGQLFSDQSNYPQALEYYQKSLKIYKEINDRNEISSILNKIGNIYKKQGNYPQALESFQKSLEISIEIADKKGVSMCLNNIGQIHVYLGNYPKALEYYQKSLKIYEELGDKKGISRRLNNIGVISFNQGNYPQALESFQKSLEIFEEIDDRKGISGCYNNIGLIYYKQGNYNQALESFQKSLKIYEEFNDKMRISGCLNNLGLINHDQGNYSKALEYYQKSLEIFEEIGDKEGISDCLDNIGTVYTDEGNYLQALEYYQKSLKIREDIGYKSGIGTSYESIGATYLEMNDFSEALDYTSRSLKIANELSSLEAQKNAHEILYKIYNSTKNYKKALENYVKYKELNDSLFNEENIKRITGLQYQYEYEKEKQAMVLEQQKKEAVHAEEVKHQKTISYSFIGGFILMVIIALIVLRSFFIKRKANQILAEQKLRIEQANKELSMQKEEIQSFARKLEEANHTKDKFFSIIAHDLKSPFNSILGFSTLLLENHKEYDEDSREEMIKLINKGSQSAFNLLENLFTWALSQSGKMQFSPKKLDLKLIVDDVINILEGSAKRKEISIVNNVRSNEYVHVDENMIRTVLRNLISNSIKFTHKKGNITVSSSNENTDLVNVIISDTGVGMDENQINDLFRIDKNKSSEGTEKEKGTGLGLILCKEFIEKHKGSIYVESSIGEGSSFTFTIPVSE